MAVTAETRTEIIQMVVGTLDAAPGFTILTELVQAYDAGTLISPELVQIMVDNPAFEQDYPLFLTNEEFAREYFTNLLSPAIPEDDALMDEVVELATGLLNGGTTRAELIFTAVDFMANASEDDPVLGAAVTQFNNKVEVAEHFSVTQELDAASVPLLQQVIDGVTNDEASVTAAKDVIDGTVAQGETITLTTDQDLVEGTAQNETIKGSFGSTTDNTANAGDEIDGGNGTDTLSLVATGTTASSAALEVSNVETITIKDVVGATFNAISVVGTPAIYFTSTIDGKTSTVTNAAEGSVIGMTGKGNLTVSYAGSADSASAWLGGVGTSASNRSTIDISNGDDTESATIDTTGTNFVTLAGGSENDDLAITGDGTNTWVISGSDALASSTTIDASAATGGNKFIMGSEFTGGDTILGGSGSDEIEADLTTGTLFSPEVSGIELLDLDFDAAATLDMKDITGTTTLSLAAGDDFAVKNANSEVTSVQMLGALKSPFGVTTSDVSGEVRYDEDSAGTLSFFAAANHLNHLAFENITSLSYTVLSSSGLGVLFDNLGGQGMSFTVEGGLDMTAISINVLPESSYTSLTGAAPNIDVEDGASVDAFNVSVGAEGEFRGGILLNSGGDAAAGSLGAVSISATDTASGATFEVMNDNGSIGDVTITGNDGYISGYIYASGDRGDDVFGDVGNVTIDLTGENISGGSLGITAYGSVGDISISMEDAGYFNLGVSAFNFIEEYDDEVDQTDGNVGNISIDVGEDSDLYMDLTAEGDVGDLTFNLTGDDAYLGFSGNLEAVYSGGEFIRGDYGNIVMNVTGDDADLHFDINNSGGSFGDIDITFDGGGTLSANFTMATVSEDDVPDGMGDVTINIIDAASADIGFGFYTYSGAGGFDSMTLNISDGNKDVSLNISGGNSDHGDLVVVAGEGVNFDLSIEVLESGGSFGDIDITAGDDFSGFIGISGISGDFGGSISVTAGEDSSLYLSGGGLSGGAAPSDITVNFGDEADVDIVLAGTNDLGLITLIGGDDGDAYINLQGFASVGGIDAEAWDGDLDVNLASGGSITEGTSIIAGGSDLTVKGTVGSDAIRLGAGDDTVIFDVSATDPDSIFDFSSGDDTLDVSDIVGSEAFAGSGATYVSAGEAALGVTDDTAYVFEDGTDDSFGADTDIEDFEDLEDVATFLAAAFTGEAGTTDFVAVINDGGGTAYMYYVVVADGAGGTTLDEDAVSLIGIVDSTVAQGDVFIV